MGNCVGCTSVACDIPVSPLATESTRRRAWEEIPTQECGICLDKTHMIGRFVCCQQKGTETEGGICPQCVRQLSRITVIKTSTFIFNIKRKTTGVGICCPFCREYHIETPHKKDTILIWKGDKILQQNWICDSCKKTVDGQNSCMGFLSSTDWYCICNQCFSNLI